MHGRVKEKHRVLRSSDRQHLCPALSSACAYGMEEEEEEEEEERGKGEAHGHAHAHSQSVDEGRVGSSAPAGRQHTWEVTTVESTQVREGTMEWRRGRGEVRENVCEREVRRECVCLLVLQGSMRTMCWYGAHVDICEQA